MRRDQIIVNGEVLVVPSELVQKQDGGFGVNSPLWDCDYIESNGKYIKDEVSYQAKRLEKDYESAKENLDVLQVISNTVSFDADNGSIGMMSAVGVIANWKMFKAMVATGLLPQEAYDSIYRTTVPWRNAEDEVSKVQIETILEALEKAMRVREDVYTS